MRKLRGEFNDYKESTPRRSIQRGVWEEQIDTSDSRSDGRVVIQKSR
jgi:hypothetical protein